VSRRLAAIFAADMVGYSRLMGLDEEGTIARHKVHRRELIDPKISEYDGRIVKLMGDGMLVEFVSAVDAVLCAIDVQKAMSERETEVPDSQRIVYRIGVNLGDIIIDGEDIMGDGVNIAARLEAQAEPGGICISGKVFHEVANKVKLDFADLGELKIKNIAQPVRAYRAVLANTPAITDQVALTDDKPGVAVLPFDNLSQDPEQQYFSDGLSEDILTLLSAWRSFPVVSRNSSFAFRGQSRDVRQIAKDLSARYVIEGSVRKSDNRVRVTAQLIDADTGHHIWAEKFDGALDDVFEIQDEITRQIVSSVEPEMEAAERNKAATKRPSNLSAWDYYLQGRSLLHMFTSQDNVEARSLFEKAIELDPLYSDAHAGLSLSFQRDILLEAAEDRAAVEQRALETGRRAVALDDGSSLALTSG